jgi:cytoskeletal protein RodZ
MDYKNLHTNKKNNSEDDLIMLKLLFIFYLFVMAMGMLLPIFRLAWQLITGILGGIFR